MNTLTTSPEFRQAPAISQDNAPEEVAAQGGRGLNGYLLILSLAAVLALATAAECGSVMHPASLVYGAVLWGWWGTIACVLWKMAPRLPTVSSLSVKTIVLHVVAGSVLALVHLLMLWGIGFPLGWGPGEEHMMWGVLFNVNRFGIELLLYGFIIGVTGIVQYKLRAQDDAMRSLELQKQLSSAHLHALQMQLEPHFLFNTLNAITTLVELGRQREAVEMLSHLNVILKSTLKRTTPEKVPLSQELEMIDNYLAIEQIRFADRLQVQIKVDPGALDGMVPCFLLQPIVENAIRHGIARCVSEGVVEASARRDGGSLLLRVRDTGAEAGAQAQKGHGIGLKNTRERLLHFYQNEFAMRAEPLEDGGFEVAITIPYEPQTL
ncbi:histidine kinase [Tunturiibacter empetritectus]|uniref:Signal transduction histidine kinase n=1 Tax=Tunturiibacter lichenicola TaxID=2051959 RepID=A0A852VLE0_9BACT|nr:histidine kinase [Edaphobacter lichenicola]NYF90376.1 signal transduction histidine kinase [Edaphobacter lichenicola]